MARIDIFISPYQHAARARPCQRPVRLLAHACENLKAQARINGPMAEPVLVARKVYKSFGRRQVLRGVDLSVGRGERYVLLGPNGAGKTTLLRVLAMLTPPDSGEVLLFGESAVDRPADARARIGFLSHEPCLYPELSALENLEFFGSLYGVADRGARAAAMLREVGLDHRAHDRVETFSRGMRQRLGLARAVLHSPELVLLDEPYTGLDLRAQDALGELIVRMSGAGTAFLAITHDVAHGLDIATRGGVLASGRIVHESDQAGLEDLRSRYASIVREVEP